MQMFSTSMGVFNFTLTTAQVTYEACTTEIHLWRCCGRVTRCSCAFDLVNKLAETCANSTGNWKSS